MATPLILKHRPIGDNQDDYGVLEDGVIVGRIFLSLIAPKDTPWFWSWLTPTSRTGDRRTATRPRARLRRLLPGVGTGRRWWKRLGRL